MGEVAWAGLDSTRLGLGAGLSYWKNGELVRIDVLFPGHVDCVT